MNQSLLLALIFGFRFAAGFATNDHGSDSVFGLERKRLDAKPFRSFFFNTADSGFGNLRSLLEEARDLEMSMSMSLSMSLSSGPVATSPSSVAPGPNQAPVDGPVATSPSSVAPGPNQAPVDTPAGTSSPDGNVVSPVASPPSPVSPEAVAPSNQVPGMVVPMTTAPVSSAPAPSASVTSFPTTPVPTTQAPATQAPATQAPVTQAPATQAPVTQAPITQAPVTQAPITQAPVLTAATADPTSLSDMLDTVGIYECTDQGVILAGTPGNAITHINLTVAYSAEVDGTEISPEITNRIEAELLLAAIAAALGCESSSVNNRLLRQQERTLRASTDTIGPCNTTVANASCFVMETDLEFKLNKDVDEARAAYLAYLSVRGGMNNDTFVENIDKVHKLKYLAPSPLVAPPTNSSQPLDSGGDDVDQGGNRTSKLKKITIATMSTGLLVLGVFVGGYWYSRKTKRHVELKEDLSVSPVSLFSAEMEVEDA